jgi:hypothetical protein
MSIESKLLESMSEWIFSVTRDGQFIDITGIRDGRGEIKQQEIFIRFEIFINEEMAEKYVEIWKLTYENPYNLRVIEGNVNKIQNIVLEVINAPPLP